jgi:hypothetical protein
VRWPFVSRARYELLEHNAEKMRELNAERSKADENYCMHWVNRHDALSAKYDALLDRYDSLARLMVNAPLPLVHEPVVVEPIDEMPPQVVLDAMRTISPVRDKTYDANWAFWEANKERAKEHPDAFAEEILDGFTEPGNWPDPRHPGDT